MGTNTQAHYPSVFNNYSYIATFQTEQIKALAFSV